MRVLIFSRDYPPRGMDRLFECTKVLSTEPARNQIETYIITFNESLTDSIQELKGLKTIRVTNPVSTHSSELNWILTLNQEVERAAANVYYQKEGKIDLIDVYNWYFIPAAVILKNALGIPFIYSFQNLVNDFSQTVNTPYHMAIKSIERLGLNEASMIITKSKKMQNYVIETYRTPEEKTKVIPHNKKNWISKVINLYKTVAGG